MIRDWVRWCAIALITLVLIISCQRTAPESGDRIITLKVSGWGAKPIEAHLLAQVLRQFEATHPGVTVKFETIADQYMDVIKTRLIGEAAPDVFYLDVLEAPFFMEQAVLEPLDSFITPDFELSDFEPGLLNAFQYNHHLYGLPKDYSTLALFYNKKAFAKAGIDHPPTTWEELLADSKRLTVDQNGDGKPEQYGLGFTADLARLVYVIQAHGGRVLDEQGNAAFASESALKGLELVIQQYREAHTSALPSDVGSSSDSDMFGRGQAAMMIGGNWAIPYLQETFPEIDFATAEVPRINQRSGTMVFTVAYVMNPKTLHKQAAWELIAYLTGKTGMKEWTSTGFALPTRKSVAEALKYDQDVLRSPLVSGISYATPWQIGMYPAAVMNHFNNQFTSALLGEQSLARAMQKAQDEANKQIRAAL